MDHCGHGTHISGIIGGGGQDSTGSQYTHTFYGIVRRANLINVKVLDANGSGSISSVIAGLQWVIANKNAYNIRVINCPITRTKEIRRTPRMPTSGCQALRWPPRSSPAQQR